MKKNPLSLIAMTKYERVLPRVFSRAVALEIRDEAGDSYWNLRLAGHDDGEDGPTTSAEPAVGWSELAPGIERRQLPSGQVQFRAPLVARDDGQAGWLVVTYSTKSGIPMATAPPAVRRAFADACALLQDEMDLQSECDQLAIELTERYEELNLVYATKDQVELLEEGQEALARLVHNCVDYLDVAFATIICRDRGLSLHEVNKQNAPVDVDGLLELFSGDMYDRIQSHLQCVILNEDDEEERRRLFGGRRENVLAFPILNDQGAAIGLLAVLANSGSHIFSNGDRNLLEVMAKKASRIIHTHHDSLTGLLNRSGFEATLLAALASTRRKNEEHCLLHIDIDQLHVVNDLMGYQEGDNVIRRIASVLRGKLRDGDVLARFGGDEFGLLLMNCDTRHAHEIAESIRSSVHDLTVISANRQLDITASIGITSVAGDSAGIVGVIANAEIACKAAKELGKDRVQIFEKDDTTLVRRSAEIEWISRIQEALRENRFALYCQRVAPLLDEHRSTHFEILVRMIDEDGKILAPAAFMPAAERYHLMPMLDRWIVQNSLRALKASWEIIAPSEAVFCINLSGQSLTNTGFLAFIMDELEATAVPSESVCFEITETAAIANIDDALVLMRALQEKGCRFALDDFGAGLSSFGYLKVLPVDYLKVDGSFVREVTSDSVSHSMVSAICQIARTMGLTTIAEFVGDKATMDILRAIGIDYVQGYWIGKPIPLPETIDQLKTGASVASA